MVKFDWDKNVKFWQYLMVSIELVWRWYLVLVRVDAWITQLWCYMVACGASTMQVVSTSLKNATGFLSEYKVKMVQSGEWSLPCHNSDGADVSTKSRGNATVTVSVYLGESVSHRLHENLLWNHVEYCNTVLKSTEAWYHTILINMC
jgi:hypothetical protein